MTDFTHDERTTMALNREGMDIIHNVLHYLQFAWGIDTPRDIMQANLMARWVLITCQMKLYNEIAAILGTDPITEEELRKHIA